MADWQILARSVTNFFKRATASRVLILAVTAMGGGAWAKPPMISVGPGEGKLDIVTWAGYFERGQSNLAFDWVTPFEKQTGCKVTLKIAGTSDEMVSLMNEGGFDLVTASGDASLRLVAARKVQEINTALVPSFGKIDPRLQNAPWHMVGGKHYGVPYQWGPNVLLYSTRVFKTAPASWDVVFREQTLPDGKSNAGRVQAYDGAISIAGAALYLAKKNPALGITDPYALTEAQYKAVLDILRAQRKIVGKYWHDIAVQVDDFTAGNAVASSSWPYQVNLLIANKQPVASTIPVEGATGWADTTMVHANARHPNCAYKWLEYSLGAKVQGDVAAWFGSNPVYAEACKGNALLGEQGCRHNGYDKFGQIKFWRTPTASEGGKSTVPYSRWVADFSSIKGGY